MLLPNKQLFKKAFAVAHHGKYIAVGLFLLICVFSPSSQPVTFANTSGTHWPMYQHDAARTGQSPYQGIGTSPRLLWQKRLPVDSPRDPVKGMISGPDGTLYYLFCAQLFAVNPSDGSIKWQHTIPGESIATPAIGNNGLIYTGNGSYFMALTDQGQEAWQGWVGWGVFGSSPALDIDGNVYFGAGTALFSLTPNGQSRWVNGLSIWANGPVAIGPDDTIYVSAGSELDAFRLDGMGKWAAYLTRSLNALTVSPTGTLYVGDGTSSPFESSQVYAFSSDGTPQWVFQVHGGQIGNNVLVSVNDITLGPDGTLYFVPTVTAPTSSETFMPALYALKPDGSLKWKTSFPLTQVFNMRSNPPPVVDRDNRIYVCVLPGTCYGVSAEGQILWQYPPISDGQPNPIYTAPYIAADGRMFIVNAAGAIQAIADPAIVPWLEPTPDSIMLQTELDTGVLTRSLGLLSTASPITWTAEIYPAVDWLSLPITRGVTPNTLTLSVTLDSLGKNVGPYRTSLVINTENSDVVNSPLYVPVEVFVGYRTYLPMVAREL